MNEIFAKWSWKRKQPEPFNTCTDAELTRSDITSKYNMGPRKVATIHPLAIRAIITYASLELGITNPRQTHTGAIGSQGDDITVAEYPSISEAELHVVTYNQNMGTFKAGVYQDPVIPTDKPANYMYTENGKSGTALFFSLLPTALADSEFNDTYQKFKACVQSGYMDLEECLMNAALMCDNLYRRIENADTLGAIGIPVKLNAGGIISPIRAMEVKNGTLIATTVLCGEFEVAKKSNVTGKKAPSITHRDFVGKYVLDESRVLTSEEEAAVPALPQWYIVPPEIKQICEHAKMTTTSTQPMRNFLMRGPAGTGKTEGARAIASALHLPYRFITCSANTEIFDLVGQILPKVRKTSNKEVPYPTFTDIRMDPASAYYTMTNTYDESITEENVYQTLIQAVVNNTEARLSTQSGGKEFEYVDTPLVEAIRYGYILEIQEPTVIANPAVLVGLNGLLDQCKSITLPTGETVMRHPDTVIVVTTNVDYAGCRGMNQSIISRMNLVVDLDEPDEATLIKRVQGITGCKDHSAIKTMAQIIKDVNEYCQEASIRDGCCGVRELISWVQSYMICNDIAQAAKYTVLASASSDGQSRMEIQSRCIDTKLAA
ncbi:MAG: AAA family ATPase [Hespellia sp.]|nr:AAA family ATPase [Hespellia sp.]